MDKTALQCFANEVIAWQRACGRHGLPWQVSDPYARWISEIMLQQTQVASVIPYFTRFMAAYPDVASLAAARGDDVMRLWAGLGYYRRAENLLKCARLIVRDYGGKFPQSAQELAALPGIGESTAAAIAAFSFGEKAAIFDGNVRRVFARLTDFGEPVDGPAAKKLFRIVQSALPDEDIADYTQGVMDLGATVCVKRPKCASCPVSAMCLARQSGRESLLPLKKAKKPRPEKERTFFLIWKDDRALFLPQKEKGVWKGLYVLPSEEGCLSGEEALKKAREIAGGITGFQKLSGFTHVFTHFRLTGHVYAARAQEAGEGFYALGEKALPSPISKLVAGFFSGAPLSL